MNVEQYERRWSRNCKLNSSIDPSWTKKFELPIESVPNINSYAPVRNSTNGEPVAQISQTPSRVLLRARITLKQEHLQGDSRNGKFLNHYD
ncbi:hypothetical protein T265_09290 [Opisthorchis viverrini]|uniref:Uncharacterized protein n=1 Tax=Opisthorchis viverrini TaxID=6198 RepID=A0A074ZAW4_OPIVI|nr:hypothetical protein T265_09290 [Opisthorchis viverrini]KER22667.1 hypothetical protein T265_09290 [Opisthorchis viverrini]